MLRLKVEKRVAIDEMVEGVLQTLKTAGSVLVKRDGVEILATSSDTAQTLTERYLVALAEKRFDSCDFTALSIMHWFCCLKIWQESHDMVLPIPVERILYVLRCHGYVYRKIHIQNCDPESRSDVGNYVIDRILEALIMYKHPERIEEIPEEMKAVHFHIMDYLRTFVKATRSGG